MIPFLLLVSFVRVSAPASVTTERSFSAFLFSLAISRLESHPALGDEEDASRASNPSVHGCNKSNIASSTSCPRSNFPLPVENSMDGNAFCLGNATTDRHFRRCIRSRSSLLIIWEFHLTATNKNNQGHCMIFPKRQHWRRILHKLYQ